MLRIETTVLGGSGHWPVKSRGRRWCEMGMEHQKQNPWALWGSMWDLDSIFSALPLQL